MESALLNNYPFLFCSSRNDFFVSKRCRARAPISSTQCFKRSNFSLHCKFQHPLTLKFDIHLGKPSSFHLYFRWLKGLVFSRAATSGVIAIFIYCTNLVAGAHEDSTISSRYPCEDLGNYYSHLEGTVGTSLMEKLNSLVYGHRSLPYKEVWDALKILDAADIDNPETSSDIIEIYSQRAVPKLLAGKPEGWNREHLWPRSYGLIDGTSMSDLHNIRPADVNVNSSRGNKYYGECVAYSSGCIKPANKEAAFDTETNKEIWTPPLQVRGDIARSLMYMGVRYGIQRPSDNLHLQLSDSPSIEKREMGLLSSMLKWNELDPPSREEKLRNNRICKMYQHNRNPFIDHPEYANFIWRDVGLRSPTVYGSSSLKAWINEFHYKNKGKDENEFVEIIVRASDATQLKLVLYNGANGKMYKSLPLTNKSVFTVSDSSLGFAIYTAFISLQNGPSDGMALVSGIDGRVIQFLSYEGTLQAIDGPAKGAKSTDVKVGENEVSSKFDSLGLTGEQIEKFEWKKFVGGASPGKPNRGQRISDS